MIEEMKVRPGDLVRDTSENGYDLAHGIVLAVFPLSASNMDNCKFAYQILVFGDSHVIRDVCSCVTERMK